MTVRNAADDRRRGYRIDPADLARVHGQASLRGLDIVGVFHSHPDGEARLSAHDYASAQAGWIYVVVATIGPEPSALSAHQL